MPTILSHPAIPLAIGLALGTNVVSRKLLLAGVVASILPDMDVIGFRLGISYGHELGHRGVTHSLAFAIVLGITAAFFARRLHATSRVAFLFIVGAAASHGLLDMLTNGGHGVALLWPISGERFFFPFRPIEVSPLSAHRFFGPAGLATLYAELLWVWLPSVVAGCALYFAYKKIKLARPQ